MLYKYRYGKLASMDMLDFELYYCSTECYYTFPEFSYFNLFEYDATVFTSYVNCIEDVDLIAHFTQKVRPQFREEFRSRQNMDHKLYKTPDWHIPERHKCNQLIVDSFMKDSSSLPQ